MCEAIPRSLLQFIGYNKFHQKPPASTIENLCETQYNSGYVSQVSFILFTGLIADDAISSLIMSP